MTDLVFIRNLKPLFTPIKIVGPALTVKIPHVDSAALHVALDYAEPGDVIVVSMSGDYERACWGGIVTYMAIKKGVVGAIIDGRICDVNDIIKMKFPIFSRGTSPVTTRILGLEGEIGGQIAIEDVVINPGDLVFADEDGIAILTPEKAKFYIEKLESYEKREEEIIKRIDLGESLSEISGAKKYVRVK
jgi:regulator of RNase E activity RraA